MVAIVSATATLGSGCWYDGPCRSTNVIATFPLPLFSRTKIELTIANGTHEITCPSDQVPVAGGGLGYCGNSELVIYFESVSPSEVDPVSIRATDAKGDVVFEQTMGILGRASMSDHDGMPGICDGAVDFSRGSTTGGILRCLDGDGGGATGDFAGNVFTVTIGERAVAFTDISFGSTDPVRLRVTGRLSPGAAESLTVGLVTDPRISGGILACGGAACGRMELTYTDPLFNVVWSEPAPGVSGPSSCSGTFATLPATGGRRLRGTFTGILQSEGAAPIVLDSGTIDVMLP